MTPLPFVVARFEHVVHPADAGLGADPPQARVAIEHAREYEIGDELRLVGEAARRPHRLSLVGRETFPARNSQGNTGARMPVYGHAQVLARRPERIPPRVVEMLEARTHHARFSHHHDAAMAFLHSAPRFLRRGFDPAQVRNDRERHVTIARFAPLRERIVVGPVSYTHLT